jgi:hypothetical protein
MWYIVLYCTTRATDAPGRAHYQRQNQRHTTTDYSTIIFEPTHISKQASTVAMMDGLTGQMALYALLR